MLRPESGSCEPICDLVLALLKGQSNLMRGKTSGTVVIERKGKIYTGSYTIARKMITVAYGSRAKTTQLGGSADAPEALARIMLGEIVGDEK